MQRSKQLRSPAPDTGVSDYPMPITRLFRVRIVPEPRGEFEPRFATRSVHLVNQAAGFPRLATLQPTRWAPDESAMISVWQNEAALEVFAGPDWQQPVIPPEMAQYAAECRGHHYASWAAA
ncbi:antibiotic biosynthesis monooxygenase family protein [Chitinibacteraceae bacterium HSL-7]